MQKSGFVNLLARTFVNKSSHSWK